MALGSECEINCGGTEKRKGRNDKGKERKMYGGKKVKHTTKTTKKTKKTKKAGHKGAKSKTHSGEDYTGHKGNISKSKGKDVKKDNSKLDYINLDYIKKNVVSPKKIKKSKIGKPKAKSTKGAKSKTHSGEDYTGHKGNISKSKGKDVKKDNKNVDYSKMSVKDLHKLATKRGLKGHSKDRKATLILKLKSLKFNL